VSVIDIRLNFVSNFVVIINYNVEALSTRRLKRGKKLCVRTSSVFINVTRPYSQNTYPVLLWTASTACT
jgi:hypothetical protein